MTTAELLAQTKQVANDLINNPLTDSFYRTAIQRKVSALDANSTAKAIYNTLSDLVLIAEKMQKA